MAWLALVCFNAVKDVAGDEVNNYVKFCEGNIETFVSDSVWNALKHIVKHYFKIYVKDFVKLSVTNSVRDSVKDCVMDYVNVSTKQSVLGFVKDSGLAWLGLA